MKYKRLVTVLAMLIAASAFGQSIDRVVFQQEGAYPLSEDIFEMNTQTKAGMPYSERIVNEDVRRLFALGMFADVYSEVKDLSNGNKQVTFKITAKKNVSEILFKGNRKFSDSELMKLVKLHTDMPLNDALQIESTRELRKFYDEKGYTDAQIDSSLEADGDNSVKVIFNIAEHLRVRIDNVEFEGMEVYEPSEVKDLLETRYFIGSVNWLSFMPWTFFGLPPNFGLYDKDFISRDKIRLRELYRQKGYLDFKVTDVVVTEHEDDPELVDVKFVVEEGDPYFINSIRIIGAKEFSEEELLPLLSAREEEVYSSSREDRDLKVLESKYSPLGYADFQARAVHYPDYSTHSVDVEYEIHEGTQFTIGEVYISGNRMTKDYVIRRELPFETDDPMDKDLLDIGKSRLMGMGYFQSVDGGDGVEILSMDSPEPGKKDIYINVEEKDFYDANLGFGWSDSDGLAGSIQLWHSNMDITDPMNWFTGGGQRFRVGALVGIENFDIQTDFTEPYLFGIPLRFDLSGYWREVLYEDWNEQRLGFTVSLTKRIFDDFTSVSAGYTFEYVRILDMDKKMGPFFQDAKGGERVGRVFLALNRDTRDSATNPTSGYDIGAFTYLTTRGLGASNDYYKFELRAVNYFPFLHDWFVLTTGAKIGTMGTFNSDPVPLYDRYFLGGGDSVRGFPYRSIGPVDNNDDNYGGEFMYLFTAELSHPIYKNYLRGAVFCDVGDATSAHFGPISQPNVGVGYGLRIMVPGINMPIRLDLAYPIVCNQEGVSRKLRFHFNMGFSFSPLGH